MRDGRHPQGQCREARELGCGQDRDHACDSGLGRSGTGRADQQIQDRADRRRDQHHVDRDLAPVARVEMDPELIAHRDRERDQEQQEECISRPGVVGRVGRAPDGQVCERNRRDQEHRPRDPRSARPRVLVSRSFADEGPRDGRGEPGPGRSGECLSVGAGSRYQRRNNRDDRDRWEKGRHAGRSSTGDRRVHDPS